MVKWAIGVAIAIAIFGINIAKDRIFPEKFMEYTQEYVNENDEVVETWNYYSFIIPTEVANLPNEELVEWVYNNAPKETRDFTFLKEDDFNAWGVFRTTVDHERRKRVSISHLDESIYQFYLSGRVVMVAYHEKDGKYRVWSYD